MAEWVKNTGTQKPLNAHGNRNGGAGEYTENWARSAEGKGEIRLAGTLAEKLLGATPKPPPAQVSIPGDPAPPPLPERNPAPTCSLPLPASSGERAGFLPEAGASLVSRFHRSTGTHVVSYFKLNI